MTLANVVRLNFYTTDIGELFAHFDKVNDRFENPRYATTVLGVAAATGARVRRDAGGNRGRLIHDLLTGRSRRPYEHRKGEAAW